MKRSEAEIFARKFHIGQMYGNKPYADAHLAKVVEAVSKDPFAQPEHIEIAWLHDVIEDTDCSIGDLITAGFSTVVCNAVADLTRFEEESYLDYLRNLARNPDAALVKYWDSYCNYQSSGKLKYKHNMDYLAPILEMYWANPITPAVVDIYGIYEKYKSL